MEKEDDKGDKSLRVECYQGDASVAEELSASALHLLLLVLDLIGYCLPVLGKE